MVDKTLLTDVGQTVISFTKYGCDAVAVRSERTRGNLKGSLLRVTNR